MILQSRIHAKSLQVEGRTHYHPEIQIMKDYDRLPLVTCYAGQLNQVFLNILSNAIDAIDQAQAQRSQAERLNNPGCITMRTTTISGDTVQISIADNGIGMTPAVQQRISIPGFRNAKC